ncbi:2-hydroxyacid dehydrogenase [Roseinatronobacter bogoriensis]|uniref:D-glycerate dehydrogenase n=1 Tax=Roseinatronobacter bogoriensis subsp. barguzinensis TaxID=441209 RepID=A0A2K8KHR5_9RHOB|nr:MULTISPECIES: D-glycerate dehydrogenase [Rhodobaca]ATX66378.1 D-glycerate dehydrogenase [Rhodobaca barguzinensis]MBB4207515.1 hydroxypyruvate reductase [Rhodobaca bogoriensis DSM 18756]TDW40178.1 hydroxypyruvate reductase [Rhodobaca barguzinensis]TDY70670.1 hydroxypyruvate reductase [Rhodobaca bogoriensis DSM 18756]
MSELYITRTLPDKVLRAAEAHFNVTLRAQTTPLKKGEMRAALVLYDVVIPTLGDMFAADVFEGMEDARCRLLANFGVGYNHIDVAAARAAGIAVTNTPGAVTDATADIALMLMLMSARRAAEGERLVRAGKWTGWHPTQMLGLHLGGKTCGIVGMGRIGQAIARRAHFGLGMDVIYHNRSAKSLDMPARQVGSLEELLGAADCVVLAVPGGSETRHLIGAKELSAMRPHAHLINIARGDVIEEAALIAALESGKIGGAGLDVYEKEPQVPEALRKLQNVTLLPHLGTAALDVREEMGLMAVENAIAHIQGRALINPV